MVLLEQQKFLSELGALFQATRDKGSVNITHKRSAPPASRPPPPPPKPTPPSSPRIPVPFAQHDTTHPRAESKPTKKRDWKNPAADEVETVEPAPENEEFEVIVRARTEKKKLSCCIAAKDLIKFQAAFANVIHLNATNLKRKDRAKKSKVEKAAK